MRLPALATGLLTLALVLACGGSGATEDGGGATSAGLPYGSPAFQTFQHKNDRYKFASDTRVVWTWKNMSGGAVNGEWRVEGDTVVIDWDQEATNHGTKIAKLKQVSECELAQFWRHMKEDDEIRDDDSQMFVKQVPQCTGRAR